MMNILRKCSRLEDKMEEAKTKNNDPERDYKKLQDWLKKYIPNDWDKFDLKSEYDSTLQYLENKNIIRKKVEVFLKDSKEELREKAEAVKAQQEKMLQEELKKAEAEVEEYNAKINYEVNQEIDKYYEPIRRIVDKVCKGYGNLAFIKGRPGTSKSWTVRRILTENKVDFVEVAGDVSEAYLYRLLYENNGKVIWFKDVANLLDGGSKAMNILKAATETDEARVITKNNYSRQQDDLPDRFICRCKFIFDYNNIQNKMRDDFEALISRGDYLEFTLSPKEMEHVMRQIATTPEEQEVTEFIIKHFRGSGLVRLNLRTQWKAFNTYKYAVSLGLDWQKEVSAELCRVSRVRALLYGLIGNEAVRKAELKKLLLKHELVPSMRVADYRVAEWVFTDELYEAVQGDHNGFVSLLPREEWNKPEKL